MTLSMGIFHLIFGTISGFRIEKALVKYKKKPLQIVNIESFSITKTKKVQTYKFTEYFIQSSFSSKNDPDLNSCIYFFLFF